MELEATSSVDVDEEILAVLYMLFPNPDLYKRDFWNDVYLTGYVEAHIHAVRAMRRFRYMVEGYDLFGVEIGLHGSNSPLGVSV